jgi:tRNA (guanine-N7-)-methyltransferase
MTAPQTPTPPPNLYEHAPRLPEGDVLRPEQLVRAEPGAAELEVGPGRGGFILERVGRFPEVGMVGLEIRRKWATIVDDRLRKLGLGERGRVFAEDARLALPRFAAGSYRRIYIHFPDPWWKRRHAKRRLATDDLMRELVRLLGPAGELFIQTDVEESAQAYGEAVRSLPELEPYGDAPGDPLLADNPYGAQSHRERRAIADGLPITRLRYRRRA